MEKLKRENYEDLLDEMNNILMKVRMLKKQEEQIEIIKEHADKFILLKDNLDDIANIYLVKKNNVAEQNKISNKLKKVIMGLLSLEAVFYKIEGLESYESDLLNLLAHYENRLMYRLRRSNDVEIICDCLEYQKDREDYINVIKNNDSSNNNYFTESAIRNYINDSYERIMFENVIRIIKDDSIKISKKDTKKIIKQIDSIKFINKLLSKDESEIKAVDKWMMQKYASVIIPLKASVYPEELEKDKLVREFFEGKIKNEELYLQIANAIPIEEFESLIFTINLRNTSRIIKEIKLKELSDKEKQEINALLEKAGIKISEQNEKIVDDENYLVTIQDLKGYYEETRTEDIYNEKAKFYKANIKESNDGIKMTRIEKKTYQEVSIIIKMMTKQMKSKISPKFIEFIERNKSKSKKSDINMNKKLKNQKLRTETKTLLALVYRDYLCTEEERDSLVKAERSKMSKKDAESQSNITETQLAIIEDLKWYQKLINILFKRKK